MFDFDSRRDTGGLKPVIDWKRVAQLREEVGEEDFLEIVKIFLEEVDTEIWTLCEDPSSATLEAKFHFLKGSALNLGFEQFSQRCKTGELLASQGNLEAIDLPPVLECYEASKTEFLSQMEHQFRV